MPDPASTHDPFATRCPRCQRALPAELARAGFCPRCASARLEAFTAPPGSAPPIPLAPAGAESEISAIGPYTIIQEVGRGGMGTVYLAQHAELGRLVALKVIARGGTGQSVRDLRFLREAQTVARLRHPHIVPVLDAGRTDEGQAYFAMDYIEGGDLAARIRIGPFSPRSAATLMQKVAAAIAYSHAEGVLHRDLKPSNILLDGDEPHVADFGLAGDIEHTAGLTVAPTLMGTPHYQAPEVLRSGSAAHDASAEVYALGVILYEMLTGRTPFAGASASELAQWLANRDPPTVRLLAPHVPRDLELICAKAIAVEPAQRYPAVAALETDLRCFLAGEPIVARPLSAPLRFARWMRRRPALAATWILVVALAVASTTAAFWINQERLRADAATSRAEVALEQARQSEERARAQLRTAKIAEARALRDTPGIRRRATALAALQEATAVRAGTDLRAEAVATLLRPDLVPLRTWDLASSGPVAVSIEPRGRLAAIEARGVGESWRTVVQLRRWGEAEPFVTLAVPGAVINNGPLFDPAGTRVMARFDDGSLHAWSLPDGKPLAVLTGLPTRPTSGVTGSWNGDWDMAPDGTEWVRGLEPIGVAWYRAEDGAEIARWPEGMRFTTLRWSPDGRRIAAIDVSKISERRLFVLDVKTRRAEFVQEMALAISSVNWSDDGRYLALTQEDDSVVVFDVTRNRSLRAVKSPQNDIFEASFVAADRFLTVGNSGSGMHLFDAATGREEFVLTDVGPSHVQPSSDHHGFYTTSLNGVVTDWALEPAVGVTVVPPGSRVGYDFIGSGSIFDLSPDGRWIVSAHGRFAAVRDLVSGQLVAEFDAESAPGNEDSSVVFDADGTALLRASSMQGLQRHQLIRDQGQGGEWHIGPGETLDDETGLICAAASADRRRIVLFSQNSGIIKVVDLVAATATQPAVAHLVARWIVPSAFACALSPDGSQLLVNCSGVDPAAPHARLQVFRATDGALLKTLDAPVSCDAAWSADGATAMTSNGSERSVVWNTGDWSRRLDLTGVLAGNVSSFGLSHDGRRAAIGRGNIISLVATADGTVLLQFTAQDTSGFVMFVRFLPDDRRFVVLWSDGRADVVDPDAIAAKLTSLGL